MGLPQKEQVISLLARGLDSSTMTPSLEDIELAANSQRVSERLYNLLAAGEGGRCPDRVDGVL
jgi:hypothetical protein